MHYLDALIEDMRNYADETDEQFNAIWLLCDRIDDTRISPLMRARYIDRMATALHISPASAHWVFAKMRNLPRIVKM